MAARVRARLTPSEGRRFGLTVGAALLVLAAVLAWRDHGLASTASALVGAALVISGVAIPDRLGPVHAAWMTVARAISAVTTPVFMAVIYFGVILPVGVLRRRVGGNPLVRTPGPGGTYWMDRAPGARRSDLRRQF
ncbi:MAG TPA: hypothetical protein VNZ57_03010 [Longimicrobiales bacterium]|nr:hypothetical protein [Longimicrobiales bacterium]